MPTENSAEIDASKSSNPSLYSRFSRELVLEIIGHLDTHADFVHMHSTDRTTYLAGWHERQKRCSKEIQRLTNDFLERVKITKPQYLDAYFGFHSLLAVAKKMPEKVPGNDHKPNPYREETIAMLYALVPEKLLAEFDKHYEQFKAAIVGATTESLHESFREGNIQNSLNRVTSSYLNKKHDAISQDLVLAINNQFFMLHTEGFARGVGAWKGPMPEYIMDRFKQSTQTHAGELLKKLRGEVNLPFEEKMRSGVKLI